MSRLQHVLVGVAVGVSQQQVVVQLLRIVRLWMNEYGYFNFVFNFVLSLLTDGLLDSKVRRRPGRCDLDRASRAGSE